MFHMLDHIREVVFREGEQGGYGLDLRNDDKPVWIRRMNHVALIDEPQSDTAAQRRRNLAINQLQFLVVNLRLIRANRAFELSNSRFLRVQLLLRNHALFDQLIVAIIVDSRIDELGLVAGQLPFHLLQCNLEGARVDLGKEVAFLYKLALREIDLLERSIDSALHGHSVESGY